MHAFLRYAGTWFQGSTKDLVFRRMVRPAARNALRSWLGQGVAWDAYLTLCMQLLQREPAGVVIDVGCNLGSTAIPIAKAFPRAHVVAVDAHPVPLAKFVRNLRWNGYPPNISIVAAAVANSPGLHRLHTSNANSGANRLSAPLAETEPTPTLYVAGSTLAEVIERFDVRHCTMLKTDVEGYDFDALTSAGDGLQPSRFPAIVAELNPDGMTAAGRSPADWLAFMQGRGYRCVELDSRRPIRSGADIPRLRPMMTTDFYFFSSSARQPPCLP